MRVAFTTSGEDLNAPLDLHFGRAPKFLVYDLETETFQVIDNKRCLDAVQGAGIQAAETIARSGAECLVTGHCGPKAFRVLSAAGVVVYQTDVSPVALALEAWRNGALRPMASADVEGHWT